MGVVIGMQIQINSVVWMKMDLEQRLYYWGIRGATVGHQHVDKQWFFSPELNKSSSGYFDSVQIYLNTVSIRFFGGDLIDVSAKTEAPLHTCVVTTAEPAVGGDNNNRDILYFPFRE